MIIQSRFPGFHHSRRAVVRYPPSQIGREALNEGHVCEDRHINFAGKLPYAISCPRGGYGIVVIKLNRWIAYPQSRAIDPSCRRSIAINTQAEPAGFT